MGFGRVEHTNINFIISADSSRYTDINNIRLRTKWQIQNISYKQDVPPVPATDDQPEIAGRTITQMLDIAVAGEEKLKPGVHFFVSDLFSVTAFRNMVIKINGVIISGRCE